MSYIKIPKVYEKLKKAEDFYAPVIMTAATGWGKSAAAEYYYRRKNPCVLYCMDGGITDMPNPGTIRNNVVIIENMQWLADEDGIRYIKSLLYIKGIQVVMLTRGEIPNYLLSESLDLGFVRIQERDCAFTEKEVAEY